MRRKHRKVGRKRRGRRWGKDHSIYYYIGSARNERDDTIIF